MGTTTHNLKCKKCSCDILSDDKTIKRAEKNNSFSNLCYKCSRGQLTKYKKVGKEELIDLYIKKELTSRQIGKILRVSHKSVLNWLKQYGIERRVAGGIAKIPFWKGRELPKETREKISKVKIKNGDWRGEKNPKWNGGTSEIPYDERFNKALKRKVFERDEFTCQICMEYPLNKLACHHIDKNKQNSVIENLITLCPSCHNKVHSKKEITYGRFELSHHIG